MLVINVFLCLRVHIIYAKYASLFRFTDFIYIIQISAKRNILLYQIIPITNNIHYTSKEPNRDFYNNFELRSLKCATEGKKKLIWKKLQKIYWRWDVSGTETGFAVFAKNSLEKVSSLRVLFNNPFKICIVRNVQKL